MNKFLDGPRGLAAVLLLAAIARASCLWQFGGNLARDVDDYRGIAENIVSGHGYSNPGTKLPTAYRPPLYPLLLTFVLWGGTTLIGTLHLLLGVATVALTYLTAIGLELSRRAALVATALVAVDPLLVYNTSLVMTETLAATLVAGTLALLANPNRKPFALGVLFGLCCLCRPTFWAWIVVGWAAPTIARYSTTRDARWWAQPTLLAVGIVLIIAPWAIRNAIVMGHPIVTTTHGGYTLLLGHNPVYYRDVVAQSRGAVWSGESLRAWQGSLDASMAVETPRPESEIERDRWMYRQARQFITNEPTMALHSGFTLLGRLWTIVPLGETTSESPPIIRWSVGLFYTATFVLMLVGFIRLARSEWLAWWPAVALLASFSAVHFFYWADMRMRAPLVPAIALLAARGLISKTQARESDVI